MEKFFDLFEEITPRMVSMNCFSALDDDWMLITAGKIDDFNLMTASWGAFGILWDKPISVIFVRPTRYTFGFTERYPYYTLSFFNDEYKSILQFCGSHSGRVTNKVKETGLIPIITPNGNITYEQASLVFECKKLYTDDLKKDHFIYPAIEQTIYPKKDYHRFYIGEIVHIFQKKV